MLSNNEKSIKHIMTQIETFIWILSMPDCSLRSGEQREEPHLSNMYLDVLSREHFINKYAKFKVHMKSCNRMSAEIWRAERRAMQGRAMTNEQTNRSATASCHRAVTHENITPLQAEDI